MKILSTILMFCLAINLTFGQNEPKITIDVPSNQKPWTTVEWNDSPSQFQFAIVTDRTGGHRPGVFMEGVQRLNLMQPEFVMSVGDLIEGYTEDVDRLNSEWTEFNGFIDSLKMPFFYVPGNHDITNAVMEKKWEELFGVTYYHFVYKDVLFLCLNSEDNYRGSGKGNIDNDQYDYIKKVLDENKEVKWTLVFLHQPLWVQEDTKRWNDVEKLLEERSHNVFAGHYHRYWKSQRNNGKYIALATTGGGSRLRGPAYGEFDHVVWVSMTEKGPVIANLLLEGVWDENVVTEEIVNLVRNRPFPVRINPVYIGNGAQKQLRTEVKITNDSDYQMAVNIEGMLHPTHFYDLAESEIIVEPNDVRTIGLNIANGKALDLTIMDPIQLKTEVKYVYDGRPDVVLKNNLNFAPMPDRQIYQGIVTVDGNLEEWEGDWINITNVKGSPFDYSGADDCSIKFSTSYDNENFYVGLDIIDDELYVNEKGSLWQQDALIIALDARPQHISAMNTGGGRNKDWLVYLRTFKTEDAVYDEAMLPKGVVSKVSRTEKGVQVEIAFPVEYLDKMQMKSWSNIRLGVGYYDYDENGKQRTEHSWYPVWSAKENIPGSGMMFKNEDSK